MNPEELRSAISYITVGLTIVAVSVVVLTVLMSLMYVHWSKKIVALDSLPDIQRITKSHLLVAESQMKTTRNDVASIKEMVATPNSANSGVLSGDSIRVHE